jgi:hypothetical protein
MARTDKTKPPNDYSRVSQCFSGSECPICGCRYVRIVTDELLTWPLAVMDEANVREAYAPLLTYDMKTGRLAPGALPAICNNPRCGMDESGVPHPTSYWISTVALGRGDGSAISLRKDGEQSSPGCCRIIAAQNGEWFDE